MIRIVNHKTWLPKPSDLQDLLLDLACRILNKYGGAVCPLFMNEREHLIC